MNRWLSLLSPLMGVSILAAACTTPTATAVIPAATQTPAPTATKAASSPTATATQAIKETKEVTLTRAVRPSVAATVAALEKGDIAAARAAWAVYDPLWNGMEIYISYRSLPTYQDLEVNWEAKINAALAAPDAKAADVLPMAKSLLTAWDQAIKMVETGGPISPLFDDVADIRIARQPLRQVPAALTASDVSKAKTLFTEFSGNWAKVNGLFKARSMDLHNETEAAIRAANDAFAKPASPAADLTPLVAAVTNRYGFGQNLVTTAARKADITKTAVADADVEAAGGVRGIQAALKASMSAWSTGNYAEAKAQANKGNDLFNAPVVATPLKTKTLEAALKTALEAYGALAGASGDAAKVSAANKAASEAGELAIQGLVGQFWMDPKVPASVSTVADKYSK